MLNAIQIDDDDSRIADQQAIVRALSSGLYRLPGAIRRIWKQPRWQVVEQAYDLPDVYMSYLEITIDVETSIPIRCPRSDLYWLYILHGGITIWPPDTDKVILREQAGRYRLGYLPAGGYAVQFSQGNHRLVYVVHKPSSLFREESDELCMEAAVFDAVKSQLGTPALSYSLSMANGSMAAIHAFLRAPGKTALKRKQAIQHLSLELVFLSYDATQARAGGLKIAAEWAAQMKQHIDTCIESGKGIDTASLADAFPISLSYIKHIFKTQTNEYPGAYIRAQKLLYAKRLIDDGDTPLEAARYIGWAYAHFSKAFKARFECSPRDYAATVHRR